MRADMDQKLRQIQLCAEILVPVLASMTDLKFDGATRHTIVRIQICDVATKFIFRFVVPLSVIYSTSTSNLHVQYSNSFDAFTEMQKCSSTV